MGDPYQRVTGGPQGSIAQNTGFDPQRGFLNTGFATFGNPATASNMSGSNNVRSPQPSGNSLPSSETNGSMMRNSDPILQQRLFGVLNEAGTNVSHVPTGLQLPGQSFTFQHARFAVSGADLANLMSR